jgi:hypothetical protein
MTTQEIAGVVTLVSVLSILYFAIITFGKGFYDRVGHSRKG